MTAKPNGVSLGASRSALASWKDSRPLLDRRDKPLANANLLADCPAFWCARDFEVGGVEDRRAKPSLPEDLRPLVRKTLPLAIGGDPPCDRDNLALPISAAGVEVNGQHHLVSIGAREECQRSLLPADPLTE